MKYALFLLAFLVLFAACQEQTQAPPTPALGQTPTLPITSPPTPEETRPAPPEMVEPDDTRTVAQRLFGSTQVPTQPVPADILALRERAEERTANGYSFTYTHIANGMPAQVVYAGSRIHIRDNVLVAELPRTQQLPGTTDQANRLALVEGIEYAWCTTCQQGKYRSSQRLSDLPPPTAWLYFVEDLELHGERTIDGRSTMRVMGTYQNSPVELFVDAFSGVPLRVTWQGVEHSYTRLAFGVSQDAVAIP